MEEGPSAGCVLYGQLAAMLPGDRIGDRKPEPCSLSNRLGGEEGFEDSLSERSWNSGAGIGDAQIEPPGILRRSDVDRAFSPDRIEGIRDQIHESLVEDAWVAIDEIRAVQSYLNLDTLLDAMPQDCDNGANALFDARDLAFIFVES